MIIDFYLDPACPWCWSTSRWLLEVQERRDFEVRWQPMSLWRKNQGTMAEEYVDRVFATHRMLRVCEAVRESEGNEAVGRFYTVIGTAIHHDGIPEPDLAEALEAAGCDPVLAGAADDATWDPLIAAAMDEGLALAGDDVGTPLLALDGTVALFGPIVSPVPTGDEALVLFDAVVTLARQRGFWELKRTRTARPEFNARPDVPHLADALRPVS